MASRVNRKHKRNAAKCQVYRSAGRREKSKRRKWERLISRWGRSGIKTKESAILKGKLDRKEYLLPRGGGQ